MLKAIENAARRLVLRALVGMFARTAPPLPDWDARPYRVLIIRDDGIGDFIVSIEVLRAIAERPNFTVDLVASPQNAPLARTLPFIRDVIVHKRGFLLRSWGVWRELRRRGYDVVVDARVAVRNVNMHTTCLILASGARWRIGLAGRGNDQVYSVKVAEPASPHWTYQMVALAAPFGITAESRDWRPSIPLSDEMRAAMESRWARIGPGRPRVLVNLSVGHPERWWPPERYVPVLAHLRRRRPDAAIMVVGMPTEMDLARDVAGTAGGRAEQLTLHEVIAAVASADLLISPDTSVTHAASAFRTPTLTLQRKDTGKWSPFQTPGRVAFSDDPKKIRDMPPERVIAALEELLREQDAASAP